MTLNFYFARRFLVRFAAIFMLFFIFSALTDATALVGQFGDQNLGLSGTLRLALMKAPSGAYRMLPMVAILAAILTFRALSRSSELVAARTAGRSPLATLAPAVLAALLTGALAVAALNPLSASLLRQFENETGQYKTGTVSTFSLSREGLWLRQGDANGQTVIFAERANYDATRLSGVTFFEFSYAGIVTRRIEAQAAELSKGAWHLENGKSWSVNDPDAVPDRSAKAFDTLTLPSDLTSDQILDSFGDPDTIPVWDLPGFIDRLGRSGFAVNRHMTYFQSELAMPILLVAMVILGAAFSSGHMRKGGSGLMAMYAVIAGLGVFIIRNFAEVLGANGAIPPEAAAWGPALGALLMALGLHLNLETG